MWCTPSPKLELTLLVESRRITTASSIDGWTIGAHLGPVTSHIVAGTGFFTDILASFSDVFGGRSQAYRRELDDLKRSAVDELARSAQSLGANWIIGLSIDFDEISGQGKQMFVTAIGTAVRATPSERIEMGALTLGASLTRQQLSVRAECLALVDRVASGDVRAPISIWQLARKDPTPELLAALLHVANHHRLTEAQPDGDLIVALADIAVALPPPAATDCLYQALAEQEFSLLAAGAILHAELTSLPHIEVALTKSARARRWALQTLRVPPRSVAPTDVPSLERILTNCGEPFEPAFEIVTKKGLLGKESRIWKCPCGAERSDAERSCAGCLMTLTGFSKEMLTSKEIAALVSSWLRVFA